VTRFPGAAPFITKASTLEQLGAEIQQCRGCDLYRAATQAVFGEGRQRARIMMIGEQPGDKEDVSGHPFVGPAGQLLDRALEEAGIDRSEVYVTNAVKHFKFEERGKRRLHKKPTAGEVTACRPWLEAEFECVRPDLIVCLGSTAAQAVIGRQHRLLENRGRFFEHPHAASVTATVHPSAILRSPTPEQRHQDYAAFVADLKKIREHLAEREKGGGARSTASADTPTTARIHGSGRARAPRP
jgi:DNA polymerase